MLHPDITSGAGNFFPSGRNGHWPDAVRLLKLMQHDYQGARQQLEQISLQLAEREALVNQYMQHAFIASHSYRTLRLTGYQVGDSSNQMGSTILGETACSARAPCFSNIEIRSLGRFEVHSALGQIDHWHSVKAKSVFQYLLLRPGQPAVKDALMEVLWPDCTPQAAGNNLKSAIHSLRLTLNKLFSENDRLQYILFRQGSYQINPEIHLWTDVEAFEKCWLAGRRLEKEQNIAEALLEFEKAEVLYRGDYLEDEPYEEWTLLRRESLKDIYLIILSKLADHSLRRADYESCIHYSQKILAKDEYREDTYRRLMYCYARLGQRNRALRWYEIFRETNKVGLEAGPDNETTSLYYKIQRDEEI